MYSIELPNGTLLEMPPSVQFTFELQNTVFSGSNTSVLPGSFTFPVQLPATGANLAAFNYPDLPTTSNETRTIDGVWIRAHNVRMFFGKLYLRNAGRTIEVSIVANPLTASKNLPINTLDLGGDRTYGTDDSQRHVLMRETIRYPENYDFIFFPVLNNQYYNTAPAYLSVDNEGWINRYDTFVGLFDLSGGPVIPFVKLEYLLERIFAETVTDWTFVNDWQVTTELKRLYLYNGQSLYDLESETSDLPDTINLQRHVSSTSANDFLKKVVALFNLGIFKNPFSRTINLIPLETLMKKPASHDWTEYVNGKPVVSFEDSDAFEKFCHSAGMINETRAFSSFYKPSDYPDDLSTMTQLDTVEEMIDYYNALSAGTAYVIYVRSVESVVAGTKGSGGGLLRIGDRKRRVCKVFDDSPEFIPELEVLSGNTERLDRYDMWPRYDGEGSYLMEDGEGEISIVENDNPDAITFYRGLIPQRDGSDVPCAGSSDAPVWGSVPSPITTNSVQVATAEHSLFWAGDRSLYETNWKLWHQMVRTGKPVTYNLTIPIQKLIEVNFQDKIRILNMDYFVKKLRVGGLTTDGFFKVEASLFTVI